jgi:hypothetical protein
MITVHTVDDLKMAITEYIQNVDRAILNTVFENTVRHINKWLETGRGTLWTLLLTFCIVIIRCIETFWSSCINRVYIYMSHSRRQGHSFINSKDVTPRSPSVSVSKSQRLTFHTSGSTCQKVSELLLKLSEEEKTHTFAETRSLIKGSIAVA